MPASSPESAPARRPPVIREPSEAWAGTAADLLTELRDALAPIDAAGSFRYDHIGSTSVPGLAAKPIIDLQIRMPSLPTVEALEERLGPLGYAAATGARPDSPGVYRDIPRGSEIVPAEVWEKRTFTRPSVPAHLHVRRSESPWARYTVWFRDWLTAHPAERQRYESIKRRLAAEHAGDPDQDDYTRAKTAYFDEVQAAFEDWARSRSV